MSSRYHYYRALTSITSHCLLHLQMHIAQSKGIVPLEKRNAIITKWLKPRLKLRGYSIVKNDVKMVVHIARSGGNAEEKLWLINSSNIFERSKFSHADELFILFTHMHEQLGIGSMILNADEQLKLGVIYMDEIEKTRCFDENNNQILPVNICAITNEPLTLLKKLNSITSNQHQFKLIEQKNQYCQYQIERSANAN